MSSRQKSLSFLIIAAIAIVAAFFTLSPSARAHEVANSSLVTLQCKSYIGAYTHQDFYKCGNPYGSEPITCNRNNIGTWNCSAPDPNYQYNYGRRSLTCTNPDGNTLNCKVNDDEKPFWQQSSSQDATQANGNDLSQCTDDSDPSVCSTDAQFQASNVGPSQSTNPDPLQTQESIFASESAAIDDYIG